MDTSSGVLLRDLLAQHPEKTQEVRNFCKVTDSTVRRWLKGTDPKGLTQTRLFVYLLRNGLRPAELKSTHPNIISLAVLVAHDYVDPQSAVQILGSTSAGDQQLWRWIRGVNKPLDSAMTGLSVWLRTTDDQRNVPAQLARRLLEEPFEELTSIKQIMYLPVSEAPAAGNEELIANLAALLGAAAPLARHLESDAYSDAERAHFRYLIGEDAFFKLTNSLARLSGTRARAQTPAV